MSGEYTITGLDGRPMVVTDEMLSGLGHATLYNLRERNKDPSLQNVLAGYEHRAFAREYVRDNPWMAPSMAVAVPAYTGYKQIFDTQARSKPSLSELGQGMMGVGEGALGAVADVFAPMFRR